LFGYYSNNTSYILICSSFENSKGLNESKNVPIEHRSQDVTGYMLHYYGNRFHRVPKEWRFPRCGVHDLWRQWWVGDSVRNIPPLRSIEYEDVKHLNLLELSKLEKERKSGPKTKSNRRLVTKMLNEMKFLCNFFTKQITELGKMEAIITLASVDRMFSYISHKYVGGKIFFNFFILH
jgi:hypothetical protein